MVPAQLDKLCLASAVVPGFSSAVMLCCGVLSLSLLSPLMIRPASYHLCCPKTWLLPPSVASPQQMTPWSPFEEPLQIAEWCMDITKSLLTSSGCHLCLGIWPVDPSSSCSVILWVRSSGPGLLHPERDVGFNGVFLGEETSGAAVRRTGTGPLMAGIAVLETAFS